MTISTTIQTIRVVSKAIFVFNLFVVSLMVTSISNAQIVHYQSGFESSNEPFGTGGAFSLGSLDGQGSPAWIQGRFGANPCCQTENSGNIVDTSGLPNPLTDGEQSLQLFSNATTEGEANRIDSGGGIPEWIEFLFRVEEAFIEPFNRRSTFGTIEGVGILGESPLGLQIQFQGDQNKIVAGGAVGGGEVEVGNFVDYQWHALSIQMEKEVEAPGLYTGNYTVYLDGVASAATPSYTATDKNLGGFWFAARFDENSPGNNWYVDGVIMGETHTYTGPPSTLPDVGPGDIPGDYDGNIEVALADLNLVLFNWNLDTASLPPEWMFQLPIDNVGLEELNKVLFNWGASAPTLAVPEPAFGILLIAMALLGVCTAGSRGIPKAVCHGSLR